jgi:membrane protein
VTRGHRVAAFLKRTLRDLWANNVLGLAAQTAYYCFYSLFPILLVCAPFLSLVGDREQTFQLLLDKLAPEAPPGTLTLIEGVLRDVVFVSNGPGLISVGAILALWMGSNVFSSLSDALNRASGVRETRPYWRVLLLSLAFVVAAGITSVIATTALLFGQPIVDVVANALDLAPAARIVWLVGQWVVVLAIVVALGAVMFRFLPNECLAWHEAIAGSAASAGLWVLVTIGFRLYVVHFSSYNKTYGTIGAVIVLLTWMYLSMLSVLAGGQLAAELHWERSYDGLAAGAGMDRSRASPTTGHEAGPTR